MKTRFVNAIVATAKAEAQSQSALPWTRGARRAAFVAKRTAAAPRRKSA